MIVKPSACLLALLLASAASAYTLSIKVTLTEDTLAVGSNVSIETAGVELASGRTGSDGIVKFNVSNGSYFVLLKSAIYPLQVSLIRVSGNTDITLTKRQSISYATAYGRITGPQDFSGASVAAYREGLVEKRVSCCGADFTRDGYYMLSFLPGGSYEVKFEAPEFEEFTAKEYLQQGEFLEVNARLEKAAKPPEPQPELSAPASAQLSSPIEVRLSKVGAPLANETIIAETPAGKSELVTDSEGRAAINAAQSGLYSFTYKTLVAMTSVPPAEAKVEGKQEPVLIPPAQEPQTPQVPQQQEPPSGRELLEASALFFILLLVCILALLVWAKLVSPALARAKEKEVERLREEAKQEFPSSRHAKRRKK